MVSVYVVPPVWLTGWPRSTPRYHRHESCWCGAVFHPLPWRIGARSVK